MNNLSEYLRNTVDMVANHRIVKEVLGTNQNEFKQKLFHFLNNAYFYALSLIRMALFLLTSLISHVRENYLLGEKSVKNQTLLITGAGGYLGRQLAIQFAKRNAKLILWDINEEGNKQTVKSLEELGYHDAHFNTVDIANHDQLEAAANNVKEKFGFVSMVVMAAAPTFEAKSILQTDYERDVKKHFQISYLAQLWLIQKFIKPMIKNNQGHFVTVSSTSALMDVPLISSYASFKSAQAKLMETLREELAFNNITGVKTSIVYMTVLAGGLADGFFDSYKFGKDITLTAEQASKIIAEGILRNYSYIYAPKLNLLFSFAKLLLPSFLLRLIIRTKLEINSKYLVLRNVALDKSLQ